MKKTENKGLMMIIGLFVCWITGAALCGFARFLYKYFEIKILLYIIGPITIGFIFFAIIGSIREKRKKQKEVNKMVEELHDTFSK